SVGSSYRSSARGYSACAARIASGAGASLVRMAANTASRSVAPNDPIDRMEPPPGTRSPSHPPQKQRRVRAVAADRLLSRHTVDAQDSALGMAAGADAAIPPIPARLPMPV